jgi:high-affinity nickel-transport protein
VAASQKTGGSVSLRLRVLRVLRRVIVLSALTLPHLGWPTLTVAGTGFLLGCRHGLDWDHIAAITDLTAANPTDGHRSGRRRPLSLAVWYCLGHGLVIALFVVAVAMLGLDLPAGLDRVFESVVGGTLVVLGAVVLWQLGRDRSSYAYTGRLRLLVGVIRRAWARARRRGAGPAEALDDLGPRSAFAVGVLHGTGAETPTQVVLFASAGAAGSAAGAAVILLAFLSGLVLSDLGIAAVWLSGLLGARRLPALQLGLGALTGLSSLAVGLLFITNHATVLPALLGG